MIHVDPHRERGSGVFAIVGVGITLWMLAGCGGAPGARSETKPWVENCPERAVSLPLRLSNKAGDGFFPEGFRHWLKEDCTQIWVVPPISISPASPSLVLTLPMQVAGESVDFFSFITEVGEFHRAESAAPVFGAAGQAAWRIDLSPEVASALTIGTGSGTPVQVRVRLQLVLSRLGRVIKDLTLTVGGLPPS